jgi:arylsulfatase A-like enzyme
MKPVAAPAPDGVAQFSKLPYRRFPIGGRATTRDGEVLRAFRITPFCKPADGEPLIKTVSGLPNAGHFCSHRRSWNWVDAGVSFRQNPRMRIRHDQLTRTLARLALLFLAISGLPSIIVGQSATNAASTLPGSPSALPLPSANGLRPPAPRRPSIILIVTDGLGYGDLGCYGQTKIKTPNIDQMAAEGVRFTDFYAGSSVDAPSRAALMTGLHTGHAWIRGNNGAGLHSTDLTVAELLRKSGYHTGLVGEWALGNPGTGGVPQRKGFDEFVGYLDQVHAQDYYASYLWRYDPRNQFDDKEIFPENQGGKHGIYMPDLFTRAATNFVVQSAPSGLNRHQSFFLYLAYNVPRANNELAQRTGNGMQVPSDTPYSAEPWPQAEKDRAAMITRLDGDIGKLLASLKRSKIDEDAIILFTSANGPAKEGGVNPTFLASQGPLRGLKGDLYEGGIRVPMIVRWPAKVKPGQVSDLVWTFWDFLPTAAEIAEAEPPPKIDGISMLPALSGRPQTNQHDFLYWELHENGFQQAVRMGDWKAVRTAPGKPLELYNLKRDIGEKSDVASQNAAVVARIEDYLKSARTDVESPAASAPSEAAFTTNNVPAAVATASTPDNPAAQGQGAKKAPLLIFAAVIVFGGLAWMLVRNPGTKTAGPDKGSGEGGASP